MTDDRRLRQMAEKLLHARAKGIVIPGETPASGPADLDEVYEIQRLVAAGIGPVGAFKAGRQSPDEVPTMAPILASVVRPSPARFGPSELNLIGIELEIAFLVHRPLPAADEADFVERVRACVRPLAAIEIINSRLADFDDTGPLWKLADNQINGGFVPGEAVGDWEGLEMSTPDVRLDIDGVTVLDGPASVPGGNAFDNFCAFARLVGDHCGGLVPGRYVTTGTLTGLRFVEPGSQVTGHVGGLGTVSVGFAAR